MLSSHTTGGKIQLSKNLLEVAFVHDHWTDPEYNRFIRDCHNTDNIEDIMSENGCCCREAKIIECIIKERATIHDPEAEAEVLQKMKSLLNQVLLSRILHLLYKKEDHKSNGKTSETKVQQLTTSSGTV